MRRPVPYSPPGGPSWGAPPEGFDPAGAANAPASGAPAGSPQAAPAELASTTRVLGWVLGGFALLTLGSRWLQLQGALAMWRVSQQTRAALAEVTAINAEYVRAAGISPEQLAPVDMSGGVLAMTFQASLAGASGVIAGGLAGLVALLVLVRSRRASRIGARGLRFATVAIVLAYVADLWASRAAATAAQDQLARVSAGAGEQAAAVFGAMARMTEAAMPSLTSQLVGVLIWVVPTVLFLLWGGRHLARPEVAAAFERR
ncbi:MAG: hypothetical protein KF901_13085 [Myxococcales bacterium]|nr:hypothetical protein [Myxococcales bacterium]